jgi:hypothetical protein
MWIQLTGDDGQIVAFNSAHLVALKDHGDRTLIIHSGGEAVVLESRSAIYDALGLQPFVHKVGQNERPIDLSS